MNNVNQEKNPAFSTAVFAGGCFWCVEHDLRALPGVVNAVSGYSGGDMPNPTYTNHDGHPPFAHSRYGGAQREAVQVTYDPQKISFKKLCQFFLDHIDPTDAGGQFYDRGESYKTAIYYKNAEEKSVAESLIQELDDSGLFAPEKVAVQVLPEKLFYQAEEYHQDYAHKNPDHYNRYAAGSGRVQFVANTCAVREQKHSDWKE